jgi:hypothetical protein|nr:MAG TPA: YopX protein [Caudoviricetes sp.]
MIPKFRAWHHELGRMMSIKNMWFQEGVVEEIELNDTVMNDYITSYPDEVTIMQSTGLKDKNGKEIFEGDIVQYQNTKVPSADSKGVIRYFDNWAMFGIDIEHNEPRALFFNGLADHISLDVVGNTYENPELLE